MRAYTLLAHAIEHDRLAQAAESRLAAQADRLAADAAVDPHAANGQLQLVRAFGRVALAVVASVVVGIPVR